MIIRIKMTWALPSQFNISIDYERDGNEWIAKRWSDGWGNNVHNERTLKAGRKRGVYGWPARATKEELTAIISRPRNESVIAMIISKA